MIPAAIDLGLITILFFVLGMIKPKWPLFFMENPGRFLIVVITTILFMITATLYGEGLRREKLEKAAEQPASQSTVPAPVPVPVPEPEKPAAK
jgi:VIT1/CCC1 family predicted Fe2+/Mn2+ transporter